MPLLFNKDLQLVEVLAPDITLDVKDLYVEAMDFLDEPTNHEVDEFIFAFGELDFGAGTKFTGLQVVLIDWKVRFEAASGPSWENRDVSGGDLFGRVGSLDGAAQNPIEPSPFISTTLTQSTSPTLVETPTSGLTPTESAQLANADSAVTLFQAVEEGRWLIEEPNLMTFYLSDNVTPVVRFELFDADGNPTTINPAERRWVALP